MFRSLSQTPSLPTRIATAVTDAAAGGSSFTDYLQGWGSVAATLFSSATVVLAGFLYRHERTSRREDLDDAAAQQARTILTSELVPYGEKVEGVVIGGEGWGLETLSVTVTNHNDDPILDLNVYMFHTMRGTREDCPPREPPIPVAPKGRYERSCMVPEYTVAVSGAPEIDWNLVLDYKKIHVVVSFTDTNGRRWSRTDNGQPQRERAPVGDRQ